MIGYFTTIGLLLMISIVSLISVTLISRNTDKLYAYPYAISNYVGTIRTDVIILEREMYKLISNNSSTSILKTTAELLSMIEKLNQALAHDERTLSLLQALEKNIKGLKPIQEEILEASLRSEEEIALQIVQEKFVPLVLQAQDLATNLTTIAQDKAIHFINNSHQIKTMIIIFIVILSVLSIVSAFYISFMITKSIVTPLKQLEYMILEFASGNLSVSNTLDQKDEVGRLGYCIQKCLEQIREYIEEIGTSLESLGKGDMHVQTTLEYVGDFAPIQTSLQHITKSLNQIFKQINDTIKVTTDHTLHVHKDAYTLANKAHDQAMFTKAFYHSLLEVTEQSIKNKQNASKVHILQNQMAQLIEQSNKKITAMTDAIGTLRQGSSSIQKIVNYIDELASESHLLALNGTIEASRAGDSGRGFAIIAKEMRQLSLKSTHALQDTSDLIFHSFTLTEETAQTILETAKTFQEMVDHIHLAQETMSIIATTSTNQSSQLEGVLTDLEQFSKTTNHISEFASTSLSAADRLADQSQQLVAHLSVFRFA